MNLKDDPELRKPVDNLEASSSHSVLCELPMLATRRFEYYPYSNLVATTPELTTGLEFS